MGLSLTPSPNHPTENVHTYVTYFFVGGFPNSHLFRDWGFLYYMVLFEKKKWYFWILPMFGQCGRSEIEDGVTGADADARAALPALEHPQTFSYLSPHLDVELLS